MSNQRGRDFMLVLVAVMGLVAPSIALSSCAKKPEAHAEIAVLGKPLGPDIVAWISIPQDPGAKYRALSVERPGNGLVVIDVLREHGEAKRYTSSFIDCRRELIAVARDAVSEDQFEAQTPDLGTMASWPKNTAAERIARYACAVAGDT